MKKRFTFILIIAVLSVLVLSACGAISDVSKVGDLGKAFMTALRDGDHSASWNMLSADVQTEIGSQAAWVDFATPRNFSKWTFSSTNVSGTEGQMDGESTIGAETYVTTLVFVKVGEDWKISGINFTLK